MTPVIIKSAANGDELMPVVEAQMSPTVTALDTKASLEEFIANE